MRINLLLLLPLRVEATAAALPHCHHPGLRVDRLDSLIPTSNRGDTVRREWSRIEFALSFLSVASATMLGLKENYSSATPISSHSATIS
jgi:hypothetical protein